MEFSSREQERIVRKNIKKAVLSMLGAIGANQTRIEEMCIDRALNAGISEYGDESFHKNTEEIMVDILEELADAAFYSCIRIEHMSTGTNKLKVQSV